MRRLLVLSSIAILALLALGAGSASAARLCSTNSSPCPSPYASGTSVMGQLPSGRQAIGTNSFSNVICNSSTFSLKTTSSGGGAGTPVTGEIQSFTLTDCVTSSGMQCTAASQFLPWKAEVTGGTFGNGTLVVSLPAFKISCGFILNCSFEAGTARSMSFLGGNPASLQASNWLLSVTGGLCPTVAYFDGEYEAKSPKPLYVTGS